MPGLGMEVACPDGSTVVAEVEVGDACVDSLSGVSDCAATAGEFEACIQAQLDDPCEFFVSACDPIFACL